MDANRTPCSIEVGLDHRRKRIQVPFHVKGGPPHLVSYHAVPFRDFSPWLTADALDQFDPTGREAGEFMLEIAKAAAVNNERAHRKSGRGGSV